MDAVISTRRLLLRPFTPDDADALFDIFRRHEVARWSGDGTPMDHPGQAIQRIAGQSERAGNHPAAGIFAIVPKSESRPLGMAMLVRLPPSAGVEREDLEIGWHLHPDAWGLGYATEAAGAMVERAIAAGVEELFAVTHVDNVRSQAVCRRLGMTDLGLRDDWYDVALRAFHLPLT